MNDRDTFGKRIIHMRRIPPPTLVEWTEEDEKKWRREEAGSFAVFCVILLLVGIVSYINSHQGDHHERVSSTQAN